MRSAAAAVLVLALAIAGTAAADTTPASTGTTPQAAEQLFCTGAPTDVDTRIASMVNALGVSAPTTPPIAILDTGVSGDVPELAGRVGTPFDATTGGSDASDVNGHGSMVAAIAAGSPGLMLGVSPGSPIMAVRIFNFSAESTIPWLIGGINWAVANHAAVINISSTSLVDNVKAADVTALTHAIDDAFNKGVLVVASVGNNGRMDDEVPANLPHVIAVGASTLAGDRATFSNYGPWLDLLAPAAGLVAPMPKAYCDSGFGVVNGTSFSAPSVSATAALLAQLRPELTIQQRFDMLRKAGHDIGAAGRDDNTGYGLLDVQAAVTAQAPPKQSSPEIDDDPIYVRGANAAGHPTQLTKARKVRLSGEVSAAKDPSDVYPVRLKKGERFVASAVVSGTDSLLSLVVFKPNAGDYDVSNDVSKTQVVSTGGFADDPQLKLKAPATGTYYVAVEAPDAIDTDVDPPDEAPATEAYQLTLSKSPPLKPKKKKKKSSSKKKK